MFIINRCFKNIWLESQMIHVALFSFQRTTLSFEARFRLKGFASSDSFIVPHLFQTVKNFFIFLFCLSHPLQQGASNQGAFSCQAGVSRRLVLYYRTRRHLSTAFSKKLAKCSWKTNRICLLAETWLLSQPRLEFCSIRILPWRERTQIWQIS